MKKKAMSSYIPPELIPNILARLPINDVLRCTVVCRSWYSLITSSSFTSLHLKISTPNQTPRLLIQYKLRSTKYIQEYTLLDQNQTPNDISGLVDPLLTRETCYIVGSFNGLFLMHMFKKDVAVLWNPSLRKSIILPNHTNFTTYWRTIGFGFGFGFLPATNEYKIVRISYPLDVNNAAIGWIYEFGTGSWRNINADNVPYVIPDARQAFLKDIVHWPAYSGDHRGNPNQIGSFNMKNESFGTLMVPSLLRDLDFSLFTFQESLCLAHRQDKCFSVWVMKEYGVTDSWAKQFNIDGMHSPIYCRENGEIILETFRDLAQSDFFSYDPKKNNVIENTQLYYQWQSRFEAHNYMESLVFIKGPKSNDEEDKGCKKATLE